MQGRVTVCFKKGKKIKKPTQVLVDLNMAFEERLGCQCAEIYAGLECVGRMVFVSVTRISGNCMTLRGVEEVLSGEKFYVQSWVWFPENGGDRPVKHAKGVKEEAHHGGAEVTEKKEGVRFTRDASTGVISDAETGLEWLVGPDCDTDYAGALAWVASLSGVSGGGWRMPTVVELRTLYQWGVGARNMDSGFVTTGWWVWGEPRDESSAWGFDFLFGYEDWADRDNSHGDWVFAARP